MSEAVDSIYDRPARDYDALLVVSYGGPEGPEDVDPFLDNVLGGMKVPPHVKQEIAERYLQFGGVSPINDATREFIAALEGDLAAHGPRLPVYWGNRNWEPFLADTFEHMAADGVQRVVAFVTSMFSSYSGCRRYIEDIEEANGRLAQPLTIDKLRLGFNHPGFIAAVADRVGDALGEVSKERRGATPLLFTAHSLPLSMARNCAYVDQLLSASSLVADRLAHADWRLVYQSNNANYGEPWLEPDIVDVLAEAADGGARDVVVEPIGFVCDHMEVVLDLDREAKEAADRLGVNMLRAPTVGSHPAYVSMVRELVVERMSEDPERPALGELGAAQDRCSAGCCPRA